MPMIMAATSAIPLVKLYFLELSIVPVTDFHILADIFSVLVFNIEFDKLNAKL
jgi:hypothetical protein